MRCTDVIACLVLVINKIITIMKHRVLVVLQIIFLINARNAVSLYEVIHHGSNLSDHSAICIKCSDICLSNSNAMHNDTKGAPSGEANVKQLHWDHSNLPLYRDTTEFYYGLGGSPNLLYKP